MRSLTLLACVASFALAPMNVQAVDSDFDGVDDALDNCVLVANLDQRDTDGDGFGNLCDADLNNDCDVNFLDLGIFKDVIFTGDEDADFDGNGNVNFIDLGILKEGFFAEPGPGPAACGGAIVVRSTIYERTLWAATDLLPDGVSHAFIGVPVPEFLGADTADIMLEDIHITGLHEPVTVDMEQILLNEVSIETIELDGQLFNFTITLNPQKRSLGTMTVMQTTPDDNGPAPEGVYIREQNIEFIATLIPLNGDPPIASPGTVFVSTPVPIPFSFDPEQNVVLKKGLVGDATANWHTDKATFHRDFFTLPSLGNGVVKVPVEGCPVDALGINSPAGGGKSALAMPIGGDGCPSDPTKIDPGFCGCGVAETDSDQNNVPDCYENICAFNEFEGAFTGTCCLAGGTCPDPACEVP